VKKKFTNLTLSIHHDVSFNSDNIVLRAEVLVDGTVYTEQIILSQKAIDAEPVIVEEAREGLISRLRERVFSCTPFEQNDMGKAVCWNCIKHRHGICTGQDDEPPVGTGGPCVCKHLCLEGEDDGDQG
jgi:hypothetical protein